MGTPLVRIEHRNCTAIIVLNDPARRNVLSSDMVSAIAERFDDAEADPDVRAVVVAAEGSSFCAGAELDTLLAAGAGDFAPVERVYEAFLRIRRSPLLTIAAVQGAAVGAGFNIALACDLRVAGPQAKFDSRFAALRLHPGGGHIWMLQRILGVEATLRLVLLGEVWDADTAQRRGLVSAVDSNPVDAAIGMASTLQPLSAEFAARILATSRAAVDTSSFETALAMETRAQQWSTLLPEFIDGVEAIRRTIEKR